MRSRTTRRFREAFAKLPAHVRQSARDAYRLFAQDSAHPSLRFKKVHSREPIWSVRVDRNYRAVGIIDDDMIVWFWIGSHADYDHLLKQL